MDKMAEGAITKAERERLKAILSDTITMLCRNGLNAKFQREFSVEGLIGITVDSSELMLVSIKDIVKNPNAPPEADSDGEVSDGGTSITASNKKRKRKRHKSVDEDGVSEPKTPRTENEYDGNSMMTPGSQARRNLYPNMDDSRASLSGQSNDDFMLQEMKHDGDDDDEDLVEIIKEEPGMSGGSEDGSHIVSIQSLSHGQQQHGQFGQMPPHMMGVPPTPPHMSPGASNLPNMPPMSMGDLNEQVELMPGSGVYIKRATYNQLQFIDKGSKLVRKLVREIFPDVHLLASSSCMGKGETSAGLDRHKVEVIKAVTRERIGWTGQQVTREVNIICGQMRYQLREKEKSKP